MTLFVGWQQVQFNRLREWFEKSPFYAGSPLVNNAFAFTDEGLRELRDETGRLCCIMKVEESRKILSGAVS